MYGMGASKRRMIVKRKEKKKKRIVSTGIHRSAWYLQGTSEIPNALFELSKKKKNAFTSARFFSQSQSSMITKRTKRCACYMLHCCIEHLLAYKQISNFLFMVWCCRSDNIYSQLMRTRRNFYHLFFTFHIEYGLPFLFLVSFVFAAPCWLCVCVCVKYFRIYRDAPHHKMPKMNVRQLYRWL